MRIVITMIFVVISGWAECVVNDENTSTECIRNNFDTLGTKTEQLFNDYESIVNNLGSLRKHLLNLKKEYDGLSKKIEDTEDNESMKLKLENEKAKLQQLSLFVDNMLSGDSTDELFDTSLILGVQLQPSYNNNNENEGFKHSTLYARVNIDSRFADTPDKNGLFKGPCNFGVDLEYLGTPVESNSTNPASPTSAPSGFNEVSDTFQTTIYGSLNLFQVVKGSEVGLLGQFGFLNREKKDKNENTINKYWGGGFEYVYSDLFSSSYKPNSSMYIKRYPKAKISIVYRKYDFFAGEENADRWVLDFEYKIGAFLLGFNANGGSTNDTMYLKFALVKSLDEIADFFVKK